MFWFSKFSIIIRSSYRDMINEWVVRETEWPPWGIFFQNNAFQPPVKRETAIKMYISFYLFVYFNLRRLIPIPPKYQAIVSWAMPKELRGCVLWSAPRLAAHCQLDACALRVGLTITLIRLHLIARDFSLTRILRWLHWKHRRIHPSNCQAAYSPSRAYSSRVHAGCCGRTRSTSRGDMSVCCTKVGEVVAAQKLVTLVRIY